MAVFRVSTMVDVAGVVHGSVMTFTLGGDIPGTRPHRPQSIVRDRRLLFSVKKLGEMPERN
eukprot:CAMPEP_0194295750 /NCGR_PEP_ID=MMETSP0169-20130528/54228_1 /TAXON_ID=218684 /ORGANISM="Corethron pennatum, Strain L29A3" /LENGTH=60 /DNA_ID=CAMNT_0039044997 /DNA_START=207 /DNA_END=387 /DNA_ORIENTATION=-